jgi:tRNA A-37 threonylcarbamoyl transferase component Bud32
MATYAEILFGRVVLNNRLASHKQVAECLRNLRGRTLAEVMVSQGLLTVEQARQAQRAQALAQFIRAEKIFARILVDRRLVDAKTVRRAFNVQAQRQYKTRLAALLMEQGLLDAGQLEAIVDEQLVRLAEETARIEEQGLEGALRDSNRSEGFEADAPEDLGSVRMKNAVGPSGFIDSPRATLPMRKAAKLDDEPPHKRTMVMDSAAYSAALTESDSSTQESSEDGLIGKLVASRYKVLEKVGVGGMGTVYRAEHCLMEKVVALKVLNPELVSSQRSLERFRHEIRAASRFQHRHVIQIYDAGEGEGGIFYMAMEFAEGEDLEAVIAREGALPLDRVLAFFRQTLEAVGEAHKKKIVHRDLKSGNLMVTKDKQGFPMIKIMDFGIAKIALEEGSSSDAGGGLYRTQEGIVTGTPQYMSPEQASGEPVDHRSDLYSLGVILFEMLTGQLPFRSDTPMGFLGKHIVEPPPRPSAVRPELGIPPVLESIALRLLEKSPDDRYQTAAEVIADMDARCTPEGLQASTSGSRVGAPLARTMPARPVPQLGGPAAGGGSGHHGALGVTMEMPSGIEGSEEAPAKKRQGLLIGLVLGFLLLLTLSTSAAIYLSQTQTSSVEQEVLVRAETLLQEGRFSEVEALLEPLKEAPEAAALLAKAKEGEAKRQVDEARAQVAHADELVAGFRRGATGREAATKALRLYRDAQRWIEDEELGEKIKALEERLGPIAAVTPTPSPSRTPEPVATPAPSPKVTPSATPSRAPSPEPSSSPAGGQTRLYAASHALLEGRLSEAAQLLDQAAQGLPADHPELTRLRKYLGAEQLAEKGRQEIEAGRVSEGAGLLRRAAKAHPRAAARRELESEAKEAEVAAKEGGALRAARGAILALDPVAARKAIATAPEAEGVGPLEEAIKALERFAREWREARVGLAALAKDEGGDPAEGTRLAQLLESVATNLEGFPEGKLKVELNGALTKERAAAKQLVAELRKRRDANKSDELRRFEASLASYREQKAMAETAKVAEARLGAAQDLQYAGAYRRREASEQDRSYVDKEVNRWRSRMKVWGELRVDGGASMIRVEGGAWTPPGGKVRKLPAVFYVSSHELTCEAWDVYVRAKNRKRPRDWPRAGRLKEPVRAISLSEAKAYCRWLNQERTRVEFVVPDEFMWERAARGASGQAFPWGDAYEKWREGYAAVRIGALRPVGAFKRDHNDLGLFDVVGNVAELTRSREGSKVVIRGGSFLSARSESGAAGRIVAASGDERANHVGLRLFAVEKE